MNLSDFELLDAYFRDGSESAFTELLRRHVDLVYSAASRQVGFHPQAAEEVTQTVFGHLASKAHELRQHASLTGWLYLSTRLAATQYRRTETRRLARETSAHLMSQLLAAKDPEPEWDKIRPLLDEAMCDLNDEDRETVLLRYFERQSLAEVGKRFDLSENTARMRVQRALDKLYAALAKRGITSTAAALGVALAANAVTPSPVGMVRRIGSAIGATDVGVTAPASVTAHGVLVVLVLVSATAGLMWTSRNAFGRTPGTASNRASVHFAPQNPGVAGTNGPNGLIEREGAESGSASTNSRVQNDEFSPNDRVLELTFVTKDSGEPVSNIQVDYRAWSEFGLTNRHFAADQNGRLKVPTPLSNTTHLTLTSRGAGFADTRLQWDLPGEVVPTNYLVQLDRGVNLSGRVLDSEGNPVAGSKVQFDEVQLGSERKGIQSHEFGSIVVTTDAEGYWSLTRIASDMLKRVIVWANHPEHLSSDSFRLADSPTGQAQLMAGKYAFKLRSAHVLRGVVEDESGYPIVGAQVMVAAESENTLLRNPITGESVGERQSRKVTQTAGEGEFSVPGCASSNLFVTAVATGYAPKTVRVLTLTPESSAVHLVLGPPNLLKFRVQNEQGQPVTNAVFVFEPNFDPGRKVLEPQVHFAGRTDVEGRGEWADSPPGPHRFSFDAPGYDRQNAEWIVADGLEYGVTLTQEFSRHPPQVIRGTVTDSATGKPILSVRMAIGVSDEFPEAGHAQFSERGDYWLRFDGGHFRHSRKSFLAADGRISSWVLRFEADGYAPWFSRVIKGDESEVKLEVALVSATEFEVTILRPDGSPAVDAELGLLRKKDRLSLSKFGLLRSNNDPANLRRAAANGRLRLSADASIERVVGVHSDGYCTVPWSEVQATHVIRLEPWATIAGHFAANTEIPKEVSICPTDPMTSAVDLDFETSFQRPNSPGHFDYPKIPPGDWKIQSLWKLPRTSLDGSTLNLSGGDEVDVTVAAGETARVLLEGGIRVKGRIQLPTHFEIPPNCFWAAFARTGPYPPAEMEGNWEEQKKWREQPQIRAELKAAKVAHAHIAADGSVILAAVRPGIYRLEAALLERLPRMKRRLALFAEFVVPADGRIKELDLGILECSLPPESK